MQKHEFRAKVDEFVSEHFPHDDCTEFDEMTMADYGHFMHQLTMFLAQFEYPTERRQDEVI